MQTVAIRTGTKHLTARCSRENEELFLHVVESLADAIVYVAQTFNEQATTEKEVRKILAEHGKKATIHK